MVKPDAAGLTPGKVLLLVAFSSCAWFGAATYIRLGAPAGQFSGTEGLYTYGETALVTIPLNWLTRLMVRMPPRAMVQVIAVTSGWAGLLDGVAMSHFPWLYGSDPANILAGAAWLLWALAVAGILSLITTWRAAPAP